MPLRTYRCGASANTAIVAIFPPALADIGSAKGAETEEQSRLLRLLDCDEMQGFLFSKPVPGEILEARILASSSAGQ